MKTSIKSGQKKVNIGTRLNLKAVTNLHSLLKSRDIYFADKGPSNQSYSFSSSHAWIWELDHKESWVPKIWFFWIVVLEKTLVSP